MVYTIKQFEMLVGIDFCGLKYSLTFVEVKVFDDQQKQKVYI